MNEVTFREKMIVGAKLAKPGYTLAKLGEALGMSVDEVRVALSKKRVQAYMESEARRVFDERVGPVLAERIRGLILMAADRANELIGKGDVSPEIVLEMLKLCKEVLNASGHLRDDK